MKTLVKLESVDDMAVKFMQNYTIVHKLPHETKLYQYYLHSVFKTMADMLKCNDGNWYYRCEGDAKLCENS